MSAVMTSLESKIMNRTAKVGVIGLGYVGLPLLVAAGKAGYQVIGFDLDERKVDALRRKFSYVEDVTEDDLLLLPQASYVMRPHEGLDLDVVVIAVPTPLRDGQADLSYVEAALRSVGPALALDGLVCLESTTYPGTTREIVVPLLEREDWKAGEQFHVVYSPERIDPGSGVSVDSIPKLVAGLTESCAELGLMFYGSIVDTVIQMAGLEEAELAKLIENTFRQVNIGLVNQLVLLGSSLGADVWEALRGAATKPFGYMPFKPGPGVGGHCIPLDPLYLTHRVRQTSGASVSLIEAANEVNHRMPEYVVERVIRRLNTDGFAVKGSSLLVVGLAYKPNVGDLRESPAVAVYRKLTELGAEVLYHDPYVPEFEGRVSEPLTVAQTVRGVIVLTDHDGLHWDVLTHAPWVLDTRGAYAGANGIRL